MLFDKVSYVRLRAVVLLFLGLKLGGPAQALAGTLLSPPATDSLLIGPIGVSGADSTLATAMAAPPADSAVAPPPRRPYRSEYTVAPGETYHYDRPKPFRWLLHIPRDVGQFPGYAFRKQNTGTFVGLAVSSVALWAADRAILDWTQSLGLFMGLTPASTQKSLVNIPFHVGSTNLPLEFNVPDNTNSTMYYLGDGWTHLSIACGFWAYGGLARDNRALQTSSQLGEAILSTGLAVQTLKRLTGRQSPYVTDGTGRGEWTLFPSYSLYQSHVPNFDAFPTGHLATAMATVTVIADNYPEKHFVRPVGYGLMGLLGFAMLNNGVHWASDYPVGIALGYAFAKIAVRNGRSRVADVPADEAAPAPGGTGSLPVQAAPWYRQVRYAPYLLGPYTGVSASYRW